MYSGTTVNPKYWRHNVKCYMLCLSLAFSGCECCTETCKSIIGRCWTYRLFPFEHGRWLDEFCIALIFLMIVQNWTLKRILSQDCIRQQYGRSYACKYSRLRHGDMKDRSRVELRWEIGGIKFDGNFFSNYYLTSFHLIPVSFFLSGPLIKRIFLNLLSYWKHFILILNPHLLLFVCAHFLEWDR